MKAELRDLTGHAIVYRDSTGIWESVANGVTQVASLNEKTPESTQWSACKPGQ